MISPILLLSFYLLAPLCLALLFKKRYNLRGLTFPITALLVASYPFAVFSVIRYLRPPVEDSVINRCMTGEMAVFMVNIILMVPFSMVVQFFFNRLLIRKLR